MKAMVYGMLWRSLVVEALSAGNEDPPVLPCQEYSRKVKVIEKEMGTHNIPFLKQKRGWKLFITGSGHCFNEISLS